MITVYGSISSAPNLNSHRTEHLESETMETTGYNDNFTSDPLSDPITKLIAGAHQFKLLENAVELGIFDDLEVLMDPVPAEKLAKKQGYNLEKLTRFLDALCSLHLINKIESAKGKYLYYNSASTSKYLTRSRKPSLVPLVLMERKMVLPLMDKLPTLIMNDKSIDVMSRAKGVDSNKLNLTHTEQRNNVNNAQTGQHAPNGHHGSNGPHAPNGHAIPNGPPNGMEMQMMFLMCMDGFAAPCASALTKVFDLSACKTAVDIGGGSGAFGIELAKSYESMDVRILDLPKVVHTAKKIKGNLPDNVSFYPGNFFEDDIPQADLYILSHVIHDWDDGHIKTLLTKVYNTMPPGGSLLVLEKMFNVMKDGPEIVASSNLIMSFITQGRERTEQEYRTLLTTHGFVNTKTRRLMGSNSYDAILTTKPL